MSYSKKKLRRENSGRVQANTTENVLSMKAIRNKMYCLDPIRILLEEVGKEVILVSEGVPTILISAPKRKLVESFVGLYCQ